MENTSHSPGSTTMKTKLQPKPLLLIRPKSPHGDLNSGFSFSKAKTPQPLNLGILAKQTENARNLNPEKKLHHGPTVLSPATLEEAPKVLQNEKKWTESKEPVDMLNNASIVPFPLLPDHPTTKSSQRTKVNNPSQERNEAINKEQEALHESTNKMDKMDKPCRETVENVRFRATGVEGENGQDVVRVQSTNEEMDVGGDNHAPLRPHKKTHSSLGSKINAKVSTWTNAEEDAIHMLMFNREKLLQHCDNMLATNKAQEERIVSLKDVQSVLNVKLQDAYHCLEVRDAEIREMQALKPKLQARVRRFKDYLNGLCDEHVQLKDMGHRICEIAQEARDEHQGNMTALDAMKNSLTATQEAVTRERDSWIKIIADRDHRMKIDEQARLNLKEQLHQARILSDNECSRNETLGRELEQTRLEHEKMMDILKNNHDELAGNMIQLLEQHSQTPITNFDSNNITQMLHKCVELLESLRRKEMLSPADVYQFQASVKEETKLILSSMKSCEEQVSENITVSKQMARQIDETLAEKALVEKLYISEVAQKELQKELQKEREARLVFEEQANQSKEESLENNARQKIKDDEVATLKAALLKKSNEERLEKIATQKLRGHEIATLKAEFLAKSNEESFENTEMQKIKDNEIAALKALLVQKSKDENLKNIAMQNGKDKEITKLKAALFKVSEDKNLEIIARQKAKDDEIAKLKVALKNFDDEGRRNEAKEKAKDDEIAKLKSTFATKSKEVYNESIAALQAKDDEIAMLRVALEKARSSSPKSSNRSEFDSHQADHHVEEDNSQVEEIPRDLTDLMNGTRRAWTPRPVQSWSKIGGSKTVTSETVAGLFPQATENPSEVKVLQNQKTFGSSHALTCRQLMKVSAIREVEDSQPQIRDDRQNDGSDLDRQMLSTMSPLSPFNVSSSQRDLVLDDVTARNTVTNALGARPNTKAPRKRTAIVADLAGPYEPHQTRKTTRSSTRIYGSVIADSQSPPPAPQPIRPLKMSTTNKKGKVSMYQKKFDQYH